MYIAIEGVDGCGKTTQVELLSKTLSNFAPVHMFAEPDKGFIRQLEGADNRTLATAMYIQRLQNVKTYNAILKKHEFILSDRCFASTFAYQGQTDWFFVAGLHDAMRAHIVIPDIVAVILVDDNKAINNVEKREGRYLGDDEKRVMRAANKMYRDGVVTPGVVAFAINGNTSPDAMHNEIMRCIWQRESELKDLLE